MGVPATGSDRRISVRCGGTITAVLWAGDRVGSPQVASPQTTARRNSEDIGPASTALPPALEIVPPGLRERWSVDPTLEQLLVVPPSGVERDHVRHATGVPASRLQLDPIADLEPALLRHREIEAAAAGAEKTFDH